MHVRAVFCIHVWVACLKLAPMYQASILTNSAAFIQAHIVIIFKPIWEQCCRQKLATAFYDRNLWKMQNAEIKVEIHSYS